MKDPFSIIVGMNKRLSKSLNVNFNNLNNINHMGKSKKGMNYPQAFFSKGLNPFGDADRDGVPNLFDCRPFDKTRQDWLPKKGIEMLSFDLPESTCRHRTKVCTAACFNKPLYRIYEGSMGKADKKSYEQWHGGWTPEDFYDQWHKKTYYQGGSKKGTPRKIAVQGKVDGKSVKIGEYELPTDRTRLMSRGEAFSTEEDIPRVKAIAEEFKERDPDVLIWIPTRAWRKPHLRKKIEEEIMPIGNVRVRASTDITTTKEDHEELKKGGWGTMEFSDDAKTHTELGVKYVECPKTYKHDTGACKTCEEGCYSDKPSDSHLLSHGVGTEARDKLDRMIEEKKRKNPIEYDDTHRQNEEEVEELEKEE